MNTGINSDVCLSHSIKNANKKSPLKPRKIQVFQQIKWKGVLWRNKQIGFATPPNPIHDAKAIHPKTKWVYFSINRFAGCRLSIRDLIEHTGLHRRDVMPAIKEILERKLVKVVSEGKGSLGTVYHIEMNPEKWDLETPACAFKEREKVDFKEAPCEVLGEKALPPWERKKGDRYHPGNGNEVSVTTLVTENRETVTTLVTEPIDLNTKDLIDIGGGHNLLDGPPFQGDQQSLPLKTLVHGGRTKEKVIVPVNKNAASSERVFTALGHLLWGGSEQGIEMKGARQ